MRRLSISFLLVLLTSTAIAQTEENNSDLDQNLVFCFGAGPSLPAGDYASDDITNNEAGLARTGLNYMAYMNLKIDTKLGLVAQFHAITNPVNEDVFPESLKIHDEWSLQTVMGGLSYNARGSKANVDLKVIAGYMFANSPSMSYTTSIDNDVIVLFQESAASQSFTYGLGFNFRYRIKEQLGFFVNADYITSEHLFFVKVKYDDEPVLSIDTPQKIEIINVSLGLALRF